MPKPNDRTHNGGRYLQGISIWALSLGCIIGWGSFVMPGTSFLPDSGPVGSLIGIVLAALMCFVICSNYSFLVQKIPSSGGSYGFTRSILGEDHGFLAVWSLELAYISLLWANSTAFILLGRYLVGDFLQWGFHYTIAAYDVWAGEVLVTILIQVIFGLVTCFGKHFANILRTVFATVMFLGVCILFAGVCYKNGFSLIFRPAFSSGENHLIQILNVAVLAPWMYVGFEVVVHSVDEVRFPLKNIFRYAGFAIFAGMLIYLFLNLTASSGVPEGFENWSDYVSNLENCTGIESIPVLFNINRALGKTGLVIAAITIFCALASSVMGFLRAGARVLTFMAEAKIVPEKLATFNKNGLPVKATLVILVISLPVSFLGRTAIGWNADVATLSVSIVYAYISICTVLSAKGKENKKARILGIIGAFCSALVFFFLLIPNIFAVNALSKESYLMLALWSFVGILFYWHTFSRDKEYRFGKSTVMWIMMLFLLFFSANVWVRLQTETYISKLIGPTEEAFKIDRILLYGALIQIALTVIALVIIFFLFRTMLRREKELDYKIIQAEERSRAKSDFLSNMSHDIRTPMNAIIGFTDLALLDVQNTEKVQNALNKIKSSGTHLLSLINLVLEMSRIENGKIELSESVINLPEFLHSINIIISSQAEEKHQNLFMDVVNIKNENIISDRLRLNQVILNLASNATKYTPSGGTIQVRLIQKTPEIDGKAKYEIRVKDNGIGMSREFSEHVFDAFERERNSTISGIEGTGLGLSITKNIVDLMGGKIRVETKKGEGSEFIVELTFAVSNEKESIVNDELLKGKRALVVDDDFDTCDSLTNILIEMGLDAEWTSNSKESLVRAEQAKTRGKAFDLYLVDLRLPDLNGLELSKKICEKFGEDSGILLISASDWIRIKDEAQQSGVKGFCSKPVFASDLKRVIGKVLGENAPVIPACDAGISPDSHAELVSASPEEKTLKQVQGDTTPPLAETVQTSSPSPLFQNKRVLLVEDIAVNQEIAKMMLELYGLTVEIANDGNEAVKKISDSEQNYFDAVLMDIQMPVLNGYEATRAIRKLDRSDTKTLPIIAMTANAFDEDKKKALNAGMNAHIAKPIDREKLKETLQKYFPN